VSLIPVHWSAMDLPLRFFAFSPGKRDFAN